nr:capsid protein [Helianthus annus leaf-associated totivirus 11]
MDNFVKAIFPNYEAVGMPFKNKDGVFNTLLRGNMVADIAGAHNARGMTMAQTMTYLGRVEASLGGGPSDLDGINKNMMTPEGLINFAMLGAEIKSHSGLPAATVSAQLAQYESMPWADNQVTLLVNMLRYALLASMSEANGERGLSGHLPKYDDGHVVVSRDDYFPTNYPDGGPIRLPMSTLEHLTPAYEHERAYAPVISDPILELRGLSVKEAQFVLLMCSTWERQSRYRLDFSLPMLSRAIYYRANHEVNNINIWMDDLPSADRRDIDRTPLSAKEAFRTLVKYVSMNRLFNQFSTALHLVVSIMTQMVPATAEGQAWLGLDMKVQLPMFRACRARFPFLLSGDPAFVSHRALSEWGYIGGQMEKINMMAVTYTQAFQTGMAVRALRRNHDLDLNDIYSTELDLMNPNTMLPGAASEATRRPVPLSGMQDVYAYYDIDVEAEDATRTVTVVPKSDADIKAFAAKKIGATYVVDVATLPFAGVPTMLLPLNPFPEMTPFALHGAIDAKDMVRTRFGWETNVYTAWHWAWAARLCGYDVKIQSTYMRQGSDTFYAPNESSWTWPLLARPGMAGDKVRITDLVERRNNFVYLPPIHAPVFQGKLEFRFQIISHSVSEPNRQNPSIICDYYGVNHRISTIDTHITVAAEVRRVRGYIQRATADFQFVDTIQAGLIPPETGPTGVASVEPNDPGGGTSQPGPASAGA